MVGLQIKYFVLKPKSKTTDDVYAKASRKAILTYANEIIQIDEKFANDLIKWVAEEETKAVNLKDN